MHRFAAFMLCGLVACSGRFEPETGDAGTGVGDAGTVVDASTPQDAGPCVSADNPCADNLSASDSAPCLPWQDWCTRVRTCDDGTPYWCRQMSNCFAAPSCGPGETQSNIPCGLDEADCTTQTMCGVAVHCRAQRNCDEGPQMGCLPDSVGTSQPCGSDEPGCTPIYGCNSDGLPTAQWCHRVPECNEVPSCTRGAGTSYPCAQNDPHCERVTVCSQTIFCHF